MRRASKLTLFVLVALFALPVGGAFARTFSGLTAQRGKVMLSTDSVGAPAAIRIGWRAPCQRGGGSVPSGTSLQAPFERSSRAGFFDSNSYSYRGRKGAHNTVHVRIRGARTSGLRWRGLIRVKIVIRRHGRVAFSCRTGAVHWRAHR